MQMTVTQDNVPLPAKRIMIFALRFFLSYYKYFFLTGTIVLLLGVSIIIVINVFPDMQFGFMRYLSFIDPKYATDDFSVDLGDVMRIFSIISLGWLLLAEGGKLALKKFFNKEWPTARPRFLPLFLIITALYGAVILLIVFAKKMDAGFIPIIAIMYVANCVFAGLHALLSKWVYAVGQWSKKLEMNESI